MGDKSKNVRSENDLHKGQAISDLFIFLLFGYWAQIWIDLSFNVYVLLESISTPEKDI